MDYADRKMDELTLHLVRGRHLGFPLTELAQMTAVDLDTIILLTDDVRRADELESGEDCNGHYWN